MNVAVIGNDSRAAAIGGLLSAGGYDVWFANEEREAHAVAQCEVLILAGSRGDAQRFLGGTRANVRAIVVDAMDGRATVQSERLLTERIGSQRIVRALFVLPQAGANVLCCSDDPDAMAAIDEMLHRCGCVPTDRGPLANLDELEPPDPVLADQFDALKDANTVAKR